MAQHPDPSTQKRRSSHSHEAVLAAAADLASRLGYAGAGIEMIAAEAGVGKQTIYRWWPNKAALFIEVYTRLVPASLIADDTGTLAGDLKALLSRLSGLYVGTAAGNILSGLVAEAQTDPAIAAQLRETYVGPRRAILRSVLARAVSRGEIEPVADPDFASDLFSGAVWFRILLGERRLDESFTDQLVNAFLGAVAAKTDQSRDPDSSDDAIVPAERAAEAPVRRQ
jgi:AcrR family transcriptional regulator